MKLSLEHKIIAGFGSALVVMAAVGTVAWWIMGRLNDTFGLVNDTHRALYQLEQSANEVISLQGDIRAYVLTGKEAFLAKTGGGRTIIEESVAILRGLMADNPPQLRRLEHLSSRVEDGIVFTRKLIQTRRDGDLEGLNSLGGLGGLDRRFGEARSVIQMMEVEERRLLELRSSEARSAVAVATGVVIGTATIASLLLAAGITVVRRDFARLKVADRALAETSARYEDLYQYAPCGYHSLNEAGVFIAVNDTELSWLGYHREEVVGCKAFIDLCTPESRERFMIEFPRFIEAGSAQDLELELQRRNGSVMAVLLNATVIRDPAGRVIATRSTLYDVTARRESERAIQALNANLQHQNAQLEAVNRELEAFSYSVSHDLRAPLRHVDGFAGLLVRQYGSTLDATAHRYLDTISSGAKQMGRLIDDLLSFSHMGRVPLKRATVDQDALVTEVIRFSTHGADAPAIDWRIAPLPPVEADPAMLRQVWSNLIDNAVKYSRHAVRPTIEIGGTGALASGEHVFFVRDNGVGFDMKYVGKLFGVFQRLHGPAEFEGSGIGLAHVRRIVTRHGGRTWAEGRVGAGATFFFSLPSLPPPSSMSLHQLSTPPAAA